MVCERLAAQRDKMLACCYESITDWSHHLYSDVTDIPCNNWMFGNRGLIHESEVFCGISIFMFLLTQISSILIFSHINWLKNSLERYSLITKKDSFLLMEGWNPNFHPREELVNFLLALLSLPKLNRWGIIIFCLTCSYPPALSDTESRPSYAKRWIIRWGQANKSVSAARADLGIGMRHP